jgi:putative ABC transport system ATP-binding protein
MEDRLELAAVDGMTPALEARDLYRFYHAGDDETLALRGVSLSVDPGDLVAVTGPSGSGKSTLMACLAGLDEPDGGVVRVTGERLSRRPEATRALIRARGIGVLYQSANLVGHLSVDANVALARRLAGGSPDPPGRAAVLERMGIAGRAHARPSQLSGGELARAGLAVALANDPAVLLADEPTGELDDVTAAGVLALLRELAETGHAVVVATHDPAVASAAVHELHLRDGSVEE